jgi:hypothetical protein
MKITTVGIDLAKDIFRVHGLRRARQSRGEQVTDASGVAGFHGEAAVVPSRDGGLPHGALLGA